MSGHEHSEAAEEPADSGRPQPRRRSRRTFLGLLAGAAAIPAAAAAAGEIAGARRPAAATARESVPRPARSRPVPENSLPGDPDWQIKSLGGADDMLGYVSPATVSQGQAVTLFASTTASWFTVSVLRIGWYGGAYARLVYKSPSIRGLQQARPTLSEGTRMISTSWGDSVTLKTDDWPPGAYLLRLDADNGPQRYVPMAVVSPATAGTVVIKVPVATWQAYNTWGGYDLYNGPAGEADYYNRSLVVSLDRPFDGNGANLFMANDGPVITRAEQLGLPLSYVSGMELDANPHLLDGASALISMGHDEYWTPQERANVTAARDAGVNLAFMGANACFRRIRLEDSPLGAQRLVVCYKTAYQQDPLYGTNDELVTNDYREPPAANPESSMTGTYYESNPTSASYIVVTPDSFIFAGTGVQKGSSLPGLVGIEYDRVNPDAHVNRPIQILSHSPLTCRGVRSFGDSAYYTVPSGAGVFNSGTNRFVGALIWQGYQQFGMTQAVGDFALQATTNLLTAFAEGPAGEKYPAQDNLDEVAEWAGDPIAARRDLW